MRGDGENYESFLVERFKKKVKAFIDLVGSVCARRNQLGVLVSENYETLM